MSEPEKVYAVGVNDNGKPYVATAMIVRESEKHLRIANPSDDGHAFRYRRTLSKSGNQIHRSAADALGAFIKNHLRSIGTMEENLGLLREQIADAKEMRGALAGPAG